LKSSKTWAGAGFGLLGVGLLLRAALYFPLAAFQIDSDATLSGLCAFRVAAGQYPMFFPGGTRLSAASCYVAAGYFHLFGIGRVGLALTGLTWAALYLVCSMLFLQGILGRKAGCLAFVFAAIPSEQFMTVTYAPWAYGEIIASCAATLWLAVLWRKGGSLWRPLCFGLSVGLGIWFSLETLMSSVPAIAWLTIARRRAIAREFPAALVGVIIGTLPFFLWNATHGFASFTHNWASRPASGIDQALSNFAWLITYMAPKLLFRSSGWWSETTLLLIAYAVVAVGFVAAIRKNGKGLGSPYTPRDVGALLLLAAIGCALIFSLSEAGSSRGWTVRYIAPLYVVVPLFLALGIKMLWSWSKLLSIATIAAILLPNLLLYGLPGTTLRRQLTAELSNDERIVRLLAQKHVRMVYGDYFWVYHINFDSRESILGVPSAPVVDYFDYGDRLGTSRVEWAILGGFDEVRRLAGNVHAHGSVISDGQLSLFVADRSATNAAKLIAALRDLQPHTATGDLSADRDSCWIIQHGFRAF
jgi:hypothetical protein